MSPRRVAWMYFPFNNTAGDHGTVDLDITVDLDHSVGQKIIVLRYRLFGTNKHCMHATRRM